jgi:hypothetical protein
MSGASISADHVLDQEFPPRYQELKQEIANSYPNFEERITKAWGEILDELQKTAEIIEKEGSEGIPQVKFSELDNLDQDTIKMIKAKGSVVIRDIVDDDEAAGWKRALQEFTTTNPVIGQPEDNKQFFQLYWTKPQVLARAHPNVLKTSTWLNNLYHTKDDASRNGVDLSTPLTYADRFRIRKPGTTWDWLGPHIDSGAIERWEDPVFRKVYDAIFSGNWREHDPYELAARCNANSSIYSRKDQASIFRTFQGWLAMSETGPKEGTLEVFPNVYLSNAYVILRPFFKATVPDDSPDIVDPKNWVYDISSPQFPGLRKRPNQPGYSGPRPDNLTHPHLRLDRTMIPMPKVYPGDMVFWHCDMIHAVEREHTGTGDASVMYIGAVPTTTQNKDYIERQLTSFENLQSPVDYGTGYSEKGFIGVGTQEDILNPGARRAMGLAY